MDTYRVLLFFHIGAAVLWVGGSALLSLLALRLQRGGTSQQLADLAAQVEWFGLRYFMPLGIVTLVVGIALALDDRWDFEMLWIQLGMLGFLISLAVGAGYLGPQSGKLAKLIRERGVEDSQVRAKMDRLLLVARLDSLLLVLIVADMAIKPGL